MAKSALGKGLGALIGTRTAPTLDVQLATTEPGEWGMGVSVEWH